MQSKCKAKIIESQGQIDREGKKLTTLSTLIVLYIIGGGTVGNSVEVFGGTITFQYPLVIKFSIIFVLLYFWHSYRLHNSGWVNDIEKWIEEKLASDKKIKERLSKIVDEKSDEIIANVDERSNFYRHEIDAVKSRPAIVKNKSYYTAIIWKRWWIKSLKIKAQIASATGNQNHLCWVDFPRKVYFKRWFVIFLKKYMWSRHFIHRLLPYIAFTYASTLVIGKIITSFVF